MRKDSLAKYELHDAIIHHSTIDHDKRTIRITISYYPSSESPRRKRALLSFDGVESFSYVANAAGLLSHAWAGNISYWQPSSKRGTTFIHLVTGTIAIAAKSAAVKERA